MKDRDNGKKYARGLHQAVQHPNSFTTTRLEVLLREREVDGRASLGIASHLDSLGEDTGAAEVGLVVDVRLWNSA